jgi:hypothetical protein
VSDGLNFFNFDIIKHFLTRNLETRISYKDLALSGKTEGLWFGPGGERTLFTSANCPDRLWGPSSIILNHHFGPLRKTSRGHCVQPNTHLLMARLK